MQWFGALQIRLKHDYFNIHKMLMITYCKNMGGGVQTVANFTVPPWNRKLLLLTCTVHCAICSKYRVNMSPGLKSLTCCYSLLLLQFNIHLNCFRVMIAGVKNIYLILWENCLHDFGSLPLEHPLHGPGLSNSVAAADLCCVCVWVWA